MIGAIIKDAVVAVTKDWAKIQRQEIRDRNAADRARERMFRPSRWKRTIKEIAWDNMGKVDANVGGDGRFPAAARQLMYAMHPIVLAELSGENFSDQYFTQNLLPAFMQENRELTSDWDVVFDARGHFSEPHEGKTFGIGTLEVREYLDSFKMPSGLQDEAPHLETLFDTVGPAARSCNVLFIEKEGFLPLLESARIAERFDLAIMSTKGMSSVAARTLMQELEGVRFFVLHDFDKAGFAIVGTLQRDTWRHQFTRPVEIVDLGLRLADVKAEKLEGEPVKVRGDFPEENLRGNGAKEAEIKFLVGDGNGQRVELNAMTSPQFIKWLEGKLKKHGVKKFVPGDDVLKTAFKRAALAHELNAEIDKAFSELRREADEAEVPEDLRATVEAYLKENPGASWDFAVAEIADESGR
ncbi:MAG: hypothetical protein HY674_16500 [Chloroflexi bacterium]|nr:hypothetical protein [Chloroflexota bacterium]